MLRRDNLLDAPPRPLQQNVTDRCAPLWQMLSTLTWPPVAADAFYGVLSVAIPLHPSLGIEAAVLYCAARADSRITLSIFWDM